MARDYTQLRTFTAADTRVIDLYEFTRTLPLEKRYRVQSQIRRAFDTHDIVEGQHEAVTSTIRRYLENALGSACEVRYLLNLCIRLNILGKRDCDALIERYTEVIKGLSVLSVRIDADLLARRVPTPTTAAESR